MRPDLYFFITEEDGRFLTVKNGVVSQTAKPTPITSPDGWNELTIAWDRALKELGVVRQLSLPFGFIDDAAKILRKAHLSQSIERKLYLVIAELEPHVDLQTQEYDFVYRKLYRGQIDSGSYQNGEIKIEANVTEGGIIKLYNANRNTQYEYDLSEGDAYVKQDGLNLEQTGQYLITSSEGFYRELHFIEGSFLTREGEGSGIAFFTQNGGQVPFNYNYVNENNYLFTTTAAITGVRIKGRVKIRPNHAGGFYRLYFHRTAGAQVDLAVVNVTSRNQIDASFDVTLNTQPGEKFYLLGFRSGGPNNSIINYDETAFDISLKSRYRTTHAKAFTPFALYKKLIKSVTGKEEYAISTLLQQYNHLKLTSGDGLRGIEGAKIKTSLNDFFEFCYVVMFAGIGAEPGKISIEDRASFLTTVDPIDLGDVVDMETSEQKDELFKRLTVGYPNYQTDSVNGKYSFNHSLYFETGYTGNDKEFKLVCPYHADPLVIESNRIKLDSKNTTDDKSDNEIFILDAPFKVLVKSLLSEQTGGQNFITIYSHTAVDEFPLNTPITIANAGLLNGTYTVTAAEAVAGAIRIEVSEAVVAGSFVDATISLSFSELYRSTTATITGVPDPATIYNYRITPKTILLKWMPWFNSIFWKDAGMKFRLTKADKSDAFKVVDNGVTVEEKAAVTVGTNRLFINLEAAFDTVVPTNLAKHMEQTPNKPFRFNWTTPLGDTVTLTGFTKHAGMAPSSEKEQAFKLLLAPNNDLKLLIYG